MALRDVGARAVFEGVDGFVRDAGRMDASLDKAGKTSGAVGKMLKAGAAAGVAAVTAAMIAGGRAAIAYEAAFTGVRKTVDGTDAELAAIDAQFREMSRTIPITAVELANVGAEAGALGIQTPAIAGFTKTMAELGVATNLTSIEAAEAFARIANIMQTPQDQFDRMGSTVVALGNSLAATEKDITNMTLRLAGAGKQVGMSEAEVMSFAGALSSVGIEAEMGGSAFSRVMLDMQTAVMTNSDELKLFAAVSGQTAKEFKTSFEQDAAGAIITFLSGLKRMSDSGGNTIGVLDALGLAETRVRDTLLRASNAGDLFSRSIEIGTKAWKDNSALTTEVTKRYQDTEAQLTIMTNRLSEVGRAAGENALPGIKLFAQQLGNLVEDNKDTANWIGVKLGEAFTSAGQLAGIANYAIKEFKQNATEAGTASNAAAVGIYAAAGALFGMINPLDTVNAKLATYNGLMAGKPMTASMSSSLNAAVGYGKDMGAPVSMGKTIDFSADEAWAAAEAYNAFAAAEKKVGAAAAQTNPEFERWLKLIEEIRASMNMGAGAAKTLANGFQEAGASSQQMRQWMELAEIATDQQRAMLIALGDAAIDADPYLGDLAVTAGRIEMAFIKAGLGVDAATAAVQRIKDTLAAREAEREAEKSARDEEERKRKREQAEEEAAAQAKRDREKIVSDITGTAARDVLGGVRGRQPKDAGQAASDFGLAATGLDKLTAAGLGADVALEVMEQRLAVLAAQFTTLSGDDAASAGATTDAVRKLIEEYKAGRIGVEEFTAGIQAQQGELTRLSGVVDAAEAKWKEYQKAQWDIAAKEALDRSKEAITIWSDTLQTEVAASQLAWQRMNEQMVKDAERAAEKWQATWAPVFRQQQLMQEAGERARTFAAEFASGLTGEMDFADVGNLLARIQRELGMAGGVGGEGRLFEGLIQQALVGAFGLDWFRQITSDLRMGQSVTDLLTGWASDPEGIAGRLLGPGMTLPAAGPGVVVLPSGASGGNSQSSVTNYNLTANYSNPQEPQSIRYDLQSLRMLAGR